MTTPCRRSWEVEAARDGRLTGAARESCEAHVLACPLCAADAVALDSLARGLRSIAAPEADDVSTRRLRNRVLEAFDAERAGRSSHRGPRARRTSWTQAAGLAAALVVVIMAVGFATLASRRGSPHVEALDRSIAPAPTTTIDVIPGAGARFTRTVRDGAERFDLQEGTLRLRVRRTPTSHRVLVTTPDGEIEDIGTLFDVAVADGHTERVGVEEGRVVLRLANAPPLTIEAGGAWHSVSAPPPPAIAAGTAQTPTAQGSARASPKTRAAASASGKASAGAEDKAYLDVLRLLGEGREAEARRAAEAYLRDFPAGFRRAEMMGVASPP